MKEMLYYSVVTFVVLHRVLVIMSLINLKNDWKAKTQPECKLSKYQNIFQNTLLNEIFNNNKFKKYIYLKTKQKQE